MNTEAKDLTVSLIQGPLQWENAKANLAYFEEKINTIGNTDLIMLPEMFNSGFSMNTDRTAEDIGGPTETWLRSMAIKHNCAITGSIATKNSNQVTNRMLFATPEKCIHYDKRHLFRISAENEHFAAGSKRCIVEWRGWRLCLQVCYDLRFPVWSRNTGDFDALIYVANWPAKRSYHWRALLIARAIENQCCVVGLNRTGSDGNGLSYSGDSLMIAADGKIIIDAQDKEGVFTGNLDLSAQLNYRKKFPSHLDGDVFEIENLL